MRIVNPSTIRPNELKSGDVMIRVVTCHLDYRGNFRVYIAPYPVNPLNVSGGIPQGSQIGGGEMARQLFPVAGMAMALVETREQEEKTAATHKHTWQVYSTALTTSQLKVQCTSCPARGHVSNPTGDEWSAAYYAPSRPYLWEGGDDRVEIVECRGKDMQWKS